MTEQQEKNLRFSSLLSEIRDNGPDAGGASPLAQEPQDGPGAGTEFTAPQREAAIEVAPVQSSSAPWLFMLLLAVIGALAYHWFETRLVLARIESGLRTLQGQQQDLEPGGNRQQMMELELRLAELQAGLELQRQRLQALEQPYIDRGSGAAVGAEVVAEVVADTVAEVAADPVPAIEALPAPAEDPGPTAEQSPKLAQDPALPVTWSVILGSFRDRDRANRMAERLATGEQLIEVLEFEGDGSVQYRVAIAGLEDPREARELAQELQEQWGLRGLWVSSD